MTLSEAMDASGYDLHLFFSISLSWGLCMGFMNKTFRAVTLLFTLAVLVAGCMTGPETQHEPVFYPPLPEKPRLQFLTSISSEDDLTNKKPGLDDFILGGRETDKAMGRPYAVHAIQGKIYLTDRVSNDILLIDLVKNTISPLRAGGQGALLFPTGIWITSDGTKYIADLKRKQVVVLGPDNRFVTALGDSTVFERPVDVAVYGDRVYVCDMQKHRVVVLDRATGKQLTVIGKPGDKDGEFNRPSHVTVDQQGNVIVNDAFNFRIQKFTPNGRFMQRIGVPGSALGSLARPKGVSIDHDGNLYVVDAAFENVQIFNSDGKLLLFFGGPGEQPGSMYLPAGIAVDYANVPYFHKYADKHFKVKYLIYVCNMTGVNKLNVYGVGDWVAE